jgi:hypothetical protein
MHCLAMRCRTLSDNSSDRVPHYITSGCGPEACAPRENAHVQTPYLVPMLFMHPVNDAPHRHPSARETRCSAVSSLSTGASARAAVRSEGSGQRNERSSSVRCRQSSVAHPALVRRWCPSLCLSAYGKGGFHSPRRQGVLMRQPMRSHHPTRAGGPRTQVIA